MTISSVAAYISHHHISAPEPPNSSAPLAGELGEYGTWSAAQGGGRAVDQHHDIVRLAVRETARSAMGSPATSERDGEEAGPKMGR